MRSASIFFSLIHNLVLYAHQADSDWKISSYDLQWLALSTIGIPRVFPIGKVFCRAPMFRRQKIINKVLRGERYYILFGDESCTQGFMYRRTSLFDEDGAKNRCLDLLTKEAHMLAFTEMQEDIRRRRQPVSIETGTKYFEQFYGFRHDFYFMRMCKDARETFEKLRKLHLLSRL